MFQYTRVRYVGFFNDLDRRPFGDIECGECFRAISEAKNKLRERLASSSPCEVIRPWVGGVIDPWTDPDHLVTYAGGDITSEDFLSVSEEAYIDLYPIHRSDHPFPWGEVSSEPLKRISVGPRGGVHVENF